MSETTTAVATKSKDGIKQIDFKKKASEYLTAMGMTLPDKYKTMFLELAQAYGLNPFKREIYAVGYGNNFNVITGYEVYLKRAERTGVFDGYETSWQDDANGNIRSCTCTVYRKDRNHPTKQTVFFSEYVQNTQIWKSKPHTMIEKVAIAQAFRKAFPDELGGMPYTAEEVSNVIEETHAEVIASNPPEQTAQQQSVQAVQTQVVQQPSSEEVDKFNTFISKKDFTNAAAYVAELAKKYPKLDFSTYYKTINDGKEMQNAVAEMSKMKDAFTAEELAKIKDTWKTDWRKAIADMKTEYEAKSKQQIEQKTDEDPF